MQYSLLENSENKGKKRKLAVKWVMSSPGDPRFSGVIWRESVPPGKDISIQTCTVALSAPRGKADYPSTKNGLCLTATLYIWESVYGRKKR